MPLAVLTDEHVRIILEDLDGPELDSFREVLSAALHDYSNGTQHVDEDDIHQPQRVSVKSTVMGTTTLFMPSSSPAGLGVKVITLTSPPSEAKRVAAAIAKNGAAHKPSNASIASHRSSSSTLSQTGGSSATVTPSPMSPTTAPSPTAAPILSEPLPHIRPTGAVALFHPNGLALGFVHAQTLTAFRTALASACLVIRRGQVRVLTCFGAGLQAYWHIRLALKMRGHTIRSVNIVNHKFSASARGILKMLHGVPNELKQREGWLNCEFSLVTPGYADYDRLVREQILAADVIFCCTPGRAVAPGVPLNGATSNASTTTTGTDSSAAEDDVQSEATGHGVGHHHGGRVDEAALFDAAILTSHEGRRKGRLIIAVGSYTPQTRELPLELLRQATKPHDHGHRHFHRHAPEGGVVVVDTLDGALKEAGEIVQAGLEARQLVELGELVMLARLSVEDDTSSVSSGEVSTTGAASASSGSSILLDFEKLDISSAGSAMSSVFSSSSNNDRSGRGRQKQSSPGAHPNNNAHSSSSPSRLGRGRALSFHRQRSSSHSSTDRKRQKEDTMARWLRDGNVIYKSVGLGLMDLVVGKHLVVMARLKGIGTHIENF